MKNTKTLVFVLSLFLLLGSIAFMFPVAYAADGKFESTETTLAFQGIDISPSGALFAGATGTIYRSMDKGQTWTALHTFSGVTEIGCVFVADNGYVYAVPAGRTILDSDRGIWRSIDSGSTWSRVLTLDPTSESTVLWGFDQDNSGRLFAAVYTYSTNWGPSAYNARIYRSTDNGATWTSVYFDPNCRHFHDLKVDRTNGYIYANTGDDPLPPANAYVLRSIDGGTTWTEILSGLSQCVAICTTPSARFFGSDPNGGYIYRTTDDTTYTIVHSEPSGFYGYVAWIKRDPVSGQMFASIVDQTGTVAAKIITSVDGGNTWTTFSTFSSIGMQYGSAYASRFSGQTMYYSLNYSTYQNGRKIEYVLPPPPQTVIYKISVNAQQHDDYGLGYPATYIFEIPPEVTGGLRAYTRYSVGDSWSRLTEKTSSDFFNGIGCVRFDYAADRAYVSVAFSGGSDDIYVRLTDQTDKLIESVYLGVSEYYDNRKAAVTSSHDDWDGYFTSQFNAAINAFQSRNLWFTGGLVTQGYYSYVPRLPPDWSAAQTQISEGYVEAASHSSSHAPLPYQGNPSYDYNSEIAGSKTDISGNLALPSPFATGGTEYVWAWLEPWGTSDTTVRQRLGQSKFLADRSYYETGVIDWATWDSVNGLFNRAGITVEMGHVGAYAVSNVGVLNGWFDTAYNAGGIYHLMTHPSNVDWSAGSYANQHLDYIDGRSDVWYVGFGALYVYHYVATVANLSVETTGELSLTVNSAHGSPNPSVGVHYYSNGAMVTATVPSPVVEGNLVWTCIGWTGTGSVPATGSGTSVSFVISQNSAITWNWASSPALSLTVNSAHGSPSPSGVTYYASGTSVTASVLSPVTEGGLVWTCTGWTGTGNVPATGTGTSVTFTITGASTLTWNWQSATAQFTITPSAGTGGRISPATPQVVNYGATPSFTITPDTGYYILNVNVDGISVLGDLVNGVYTFPAVTANRAIAATFRLSNTQSGTFGSNVVGSNDISTGGNGKVASRYELTEAGTITKLTAYTRAYGTAIMRGALYADNAGSPGALLASSNEITVTSAAWYDFQFTTPYEATAGYYWLIFTWNGVGNWYYNSGGTNIWSYDYSLPNPFGSGTSRTDLVSIYATYTNVGNVAPVLGAIGPQTVAEGSLLTFTATATDNSLPPQTLTYSLDAGAPTGASINPTTGVFTWTPSEAQGPGSFSITVRVTDNGVPALSDFETISVTVTEVNVAPTITDIADISSHNELTSLSFTVTATDPDLPANTLAFSLVGNSYSASITSGGLFSWTPSEAQGPGDYTFTVRVSDGIATDDEVFSVHVVEVNVAPVLSGIPPSATIPEMTVYSFTASATDSDLPANTLVFSLVGAPTGASINPTTGVFSWTPTENQNGMFSFKVRVTDGVVNVDADISLTVTEVDSAPVLDPIGNKNIAELTLLTFTATASDIDTPPQGLTFSLTGTVPSGASITTGGVFTWTSTEAQGPGSYTFNVVVSDGTLTDSETITVTVNEVNVAPTLGTIGARSVNELALLTFTATATDTDLPANTLTFNLAGAVPSGATINSVTGLFSWTPTETQGPGSYTFDVIVSDGITTDSETITVTVSEINVAPALSGVPTSATIPELAAYSFTASATDTDVPANTLTFSLTGAPVGAAINPSTGIFSWAPSESQSPGEYTFNVIVSDGLATDSKTITLTVSEVNAAPTINPIDDITSHDELVALSFTATATDPDLPTDTLTFSLVGNTYSATINPISGLFSWTPTEAQGPGDYTFTIRVTDGSALFDDEVFSVHVNEVNIAPILANIGPKTVNELALLTFTASASDSDLPPQTLSYSLAGTVPSGAVINPSTGVFTWTPTVAQGPNSYTFTVVVSDGALTDSETITVTVVDVNVAPVLATIGNRNVNEGISLGFTATATDADVPSQTLVFSLVGAPSGATINPTTGVFTWLPTEAQGPGSYTFIVRVTDNGTPSLSDEEEITVTVSEVNVAPVLSSIGPQSGTELTLISFTASATDADLPANTLTFSLVNAPLGASINSATGVFTWTPTEAQAPSSYSFDVVVSDGALTDSETITITVNEGNVAPVLSGVPASATTPEMITYSFTATAADADYPAQTLSFSLISAPTGASINANTGVFTWTLTEIQGPGVYNFKVRVTDGVVNVDADISLTVSEVNVAPVLGAIGPQTIAEGSLLSFTASATDYDVPIQTLTYTLSGTVPSGASITTGGVFSWTPTGAQGPGSYTFDVVVSDGALADSETITVTVSTVTFTVTVVQSANGIITPGTTVVNYGGSQAFTVTPNTDYHIASITVDGSPVTVTSPTGQVVSFTNIQADHSITASFAITTYTITVTQTAHGTIVPGTSTVNYGATPSFTITPETDYHIASITVNGAPVTVTSPKSQTYQFGPISNDGSLTATYAIDTFTITPSAGSGGSISPSTTQTVSHGATPSFTVTANPGYHILDVRVDGVSVLSQLINGVYTFPAVAANHEIAASFTQAMYSIIASVTGSGGTINPSGVVSLVAGGSQVFIIEPDPGYVVADVVVDGISQGAVSQYTFNAISMDHSIIASFRQGTYTITASVDGVGGTINPSGAVLVNGGGTATFTIAPSVGYHILNVMIDGVYMGPQASFTFYEVDSSHTITATFAKDEYTLTIIIVGAGQVSTNPNKISYSYGDVVSLTATPNNKNWAFEYWSGDLTGNTNPTTIVIDGNKTVTVTFLRTR